MMPRKAKVEVGAELSKGQLRKLNALRKSVGNDIGQRAFNEWLKSTKQAPNPDVDKNAELIAGAIEDLIKEHRLVIPNTGYLLKRGRGRAIVSRPGSD